MFMSFWSQFADTTVVLSYSTIIFRIVLSFLAGALIGLERKIRQQPIGMRTVVLISVSSTLLMILSLEMSTKGTGDPGRIAAQVVSGIGFLGGGAILRQGLNIKGLTSAAIIWASAAIGLAIGAGLYIVSFLALAVCIASLIFLDKFEMKYFPAERTKHLELVFKNNRLDFKALHAVIESHGLIILNMDTGKVMSEKILRISFSVRTPDIVDILALSENIQNIGKLEEINLTD
jgi:putative Mg2+ transporter-C (MgtC) family protein